MRIDKAGWPFIVSALVPASGLALLGIEWAAALLTLLAVFFAFFFRDPERQTPVDPRAVVSPADGRVLVAGVADPAAAPPGDWQQVSIFLSPLDVHINRIPISGRVLKVEYTPGRFLAAYRWEAAAQNERNDVWIDHNGQTAVLRQVVGVLARRLVCRIRPGDEVRAGQRFGLMKFGSRMDVFLPAHVELLVRAGARVRSGETVVATW